MRILARDIQSGDGLANAAIAEAADRLEELHADHLRDDTKMAEQQARMSELLAATHAVIERWHTPLWKDSRPTAEYIAALRVAADNARHLLAGVGEPATVDVAAADGLCGRCFGKGHEHGVYERSVCPECNGSGRLLAGGE